MAELVGRTCAGDARPSSARADLLRDVMDDPDMRAGMSVDIARRDDEVLTDADAAPREDLDQPPDRPL